MNIAIDLDGTIDKLGIHVCHCFVSACHIAGVRVFVVSNRSNDDEGKATVRRWAELIGVHASQAICTNGEAKKWHCEQRGLKIDVWIDDDPSSIINGK